MALQYEIMTGLLRFTVGQIFHVMHCVALLLVKMTGSSFVHKMVE